MIMIYELGGDVWGAGETLEEALQDAMPGEITQEMPDRQLFITAGNRLLKWAVANEEAIHYWKHRLPGFAADALRRGL